MEIDLSIQAENISKQYPLRHGDKEANGKNSQSIWALNDISFKIKKGESVGVIGLNGSGKSTLLKILAGVIKPTSGKALVRGRIASILDIGAGFHPELSGRENIFLNAQIHGFSKKEVEGKLEEIISFSGIEKFINEPVKNYSNGMYLRLAFSIMAHLDFDVYLFDEVFSVGDVKFINKTKSVLSRLLDEKKTLVIVSHNMSDLLNLDKYFLIEKGVLKNISENVGIISSYIEESINLNDEELKQSTYNSIRTDFSLFPSSSDLKLIKLDFHQEEIEKFQTNKPFLIHITYEKLKDTDVFDPMIRISDLQGSVLIASSPFINGNFNESTQKGIYTYSCEIPPSIFNEKYYVLDIIFFKNSKKNLLRIKQDVQTIEGDEHVFYEKPYTFKKVLIFKPSFTNKYFEDLNFLNIDAGLAPSFKWGLKKDINT